MPPHPVTAAGIADSRRHWADVRTTRPPTANSHALVGSEKKATEGTASVATSDTVNDTAPTSARTNKYGLSENVAVLPERRLACRISQAVPIIRGGHTR